MTLKQLRVAQEMFFELMINFSVRAYEDQKIRQYNFLKYYIKRRGQVKKI